MNKNKTKQNKNKQSDKRKSRRKNNAESSFGNTLSKLPRYINIDKEKTKLHVKSTLELSNRSVNLANYVIHLGFGASATGHIYLNVVSDICFRLSNAYTRFMVTRLTVSAMGTTPTTAGGYIITNYEPASESSVLPPGSVVDVSTAINSEVATPVTPSTFTVHPSDYYSDWKVTGVAADFELSQCGSVQIYAANTQVATFSVMLLQVEFDIYFTGYRSG